MSATAGEDFSAVGFMVSLILWAATTCWVCEGERGQGLLESWCSIPLFNNVKQRHPISTPCLASQTTDRGPPPLPLRSPSESRITQMSISREFLPYRMLVFSQGSGTLSAGRAPLVVFDSRDSEGPLETLTFDSASRGRNASD